LALERTTKIAYDEYPISKTKKADAPDTPTKKVWSNAEISKMNVSEYAKYEEDIDKAVREGRIQP
jgi:hypothetical protein